MKKVGDIGHHLFLVTPSILRIKHILSYFGGNLTDKGTPLILVKCSITGRDQNPSEKCWVEFLLCGDTHKLLQDKVTLDVEILFSKVGAIEDGNFCSTLAKLVRFE